jgi:hypothetical protein
VGKIELVSNHEELLQHIDPHVLPAEMGGEGKTLFDMEEIIPSNTLNSSLTKLMSLTVGACCSGRIDRRS